VITAQEVLQGYDNIKNRVLIIGGGAVGLETAELLLEKGKDVTIVEMLNKIGQGMGATVRWNLISRLRKKSIKIFTSTQVNEISHHGITVTTDGHKEGWAGFDTIVLAVGMTSRNELADEIREKVKEVYVIGDAVDPRRGVDAMREAAEVGRKI
jgi:pyruvate/2-oxoglutarate dehydrogenase complex dihydrolipoamide dehydrogenase (E3) component